MQSAIVFELEDELPFPLEDAVYDSVTSPSYTGPGSQVHVIAAPSKHLAELLSKWSEAGIEPDAVIPEGWANRALLNRALGPASLKGSPTNPSTTSAAANFDQNPILLLNLGHERTLLYVQWRGMPVLSREIAWGGKDLTAQIGQKYALPVDKAEEAKLTSGFVLSPSQVAVATPDQVEFSNSIFEVTQSLLLEIRQAELSSKGVTHENIAAIYVAGGTSLLPGLGAAIEEELSIRVEHIQGLSAFARGSASKYTDQTEALFAGAAAAAAALHSGEKIYTMNLLRGPFSKTVAGAEMNLSQFKKPAIGAAVVAASLIVSTMVQSLVYQSRIAETDKLLEKSMRTFFGQVAASTVRTYLASPASLKQNITKELEKQREIAKISSPNPHSPIDFLKTLSTQVPRDTVVDLMLFQVGAAPDAHFESNEAGQFSVSFLVASHPVADRLTSILGGLVSGLQRTALEEHTLKDGTKKWKATFTGKPMENSYGPR